MSCSGRYYHLFIVNEAEDTPLACELNLRRWNVLRGAMVVVSQVSTGCATVRREVLHDAANPIRPGSAPDVQASMRHRLFESRGGRPPQGCHGGPTARCSAAATTAICRA